MYRVIDFGRTKRDMWPSQNCDGGQKVLKISQGEEDVKGFLGSTIYKA